LVRWGASSVGIARCLRSNVGWDSRPR
jgi:hypothetical protein